MTKKELSARLAVVCDMIKNAELDDLVREKLRAQPA